MENLWLIANKNYCVDEQRVLIMDDQRSPLQKKVVFMKQVKRRIFSGAVCEQIVFNTPNNVKNLAAYEPRPRFKTDDDRQKHKELIARRHNARLINTNFSPVSKYSTLTFDIENEVHTFSEAWQLIDLYVRRLRRVCPGAKIYIVTGRGKATKRIHIHMISDGISEDVILSKWKYGDIVSCESLRAHNFYNKIDYGADYTALANYLFDHWTPDQGGHHYFATRNMEPPDKEPPTLPKVKYSLKRPPLAPKGYELVESKANEYGYLYFKYILIKDKPKKAKRQK